MATSVPAIDELIEIPAQMLSAGAVIGPKRPPLEAREDAVNPGQEHMSRHRADNLGPVIVILQAGIRRETIADDGGFTLDDPADEAGDAHRREVAQWFDYDPTRMPFPGQICRPQRLRSIAGRCRTVPDTPTEAQNLSQITWPIWVCPNETNCCHSKSAMN